MFQSMPDLPNDRRLTDMEVATAVAQAILEDHQNPGQDLPFQARSLGLLARLGLPGRRNDAQEWRQRFFEANPTDDLDFRLAEYCWRLVGLGYLVPQGESFRPTSRGRAYLANLDATAMTTGGLDEKLRQLGYEENEPPRQYARLAQDCFLAGHYESSIVMLGVASEALVVALVEGFSRVQSTALPGLKLRKDRTTAHQDIDWLLDALGGQNRKQLRVALRSVNADEASIKTLRDILSGTTQAIRLTRNEYGHPTGFVANQDEALQLLVLFPRFAEAAIRTLESLAAIT